MPAARKSAAGESELALPRTPLPLMSDRMTALTKILQSPVRILSIMLLVVFAVEVIVMFALPYLIPEAINPAPRAFIDAGLLTVVSAPVLWWLIVSPLRRIAIQEHTRSETVVANAGEGILTISQSGRITSANRAAQELFQRPLETILGENLHSLIPGMTPDDVQRGGEIKTTGIRLPEETFPLLISISEYPYQSEVSYIAILRDLTETQRLEEQKVKDAREREALKAQQMATLAQLATGVAHEIRNPLTSIKMLIQVNRDQLAERGLPTADLDLVEQEIYRMERSVNGLLEYGRPEQGEMRTFSLNEVLRKTIRLIEGRCREADVKLETHLPERPVSLYGDAAQIQQLLLNLSLNALDAMPEGGLLNIEVEAADEDVHVRVSDRGTGIDPEVLDRLFSPFVTTKPHGVGLGLGICRRIAESHHGRLEGRNLPGGGACFELVVPAAEHSEICETN